MAKAKKEKEIEKKMDEMNRKINYIGMTVKHIVEAHLPRCKGGLIFLFIWITLLSIYVIAT